MIASVYKNQAELLLRCLPTVFTQEVFALKGGTAINFFLQDLPRLSVDIDLCFLPLDERNAALIRINDTLTDIQKSLQDRMQGLSVNPGRDSETNLKTKLFIKDRESTIKLEVNTVQRGSAFHTITSDLSKKAKQLFEMTLEGRLLDESEIYGSKICAALDRQHPRDLFDTKILLENEGITETIKNAFIVYLISHPRPISEVLSPHFKNLADVYNSEFIGMSDQTIIQSDLEDSRKTLVEEILQKLTEKDKKFLLSIKRNEPKWELFSLGHISELPAVKWKLINISRMGKEKQLKAIRKLEKVLWE